MPSIILEELHAFHSIDRDIFTRLVINLLRNPAESLLVMALWLWLEDKGYLNIIQRMLRLSDPLVNALADEAVLCLRCLECRSTYFFVPPNGGTPLTARVMERDISLHMLHQTKFTAISGIKTFLNIVCARIFTDILQQVLAATSRPHEPLDIPGFPHPIFGAITVMPWPIDYNFPIGGLWGWDSARDIPEHDRTMFLTFSRGYAVSEAEVRELFTGVYGDCVDAIIMEAVPPNEQPLYARMVLRSVSTVDHILGGRKVAKLQIHGKHIWAQKYGRREQTT